MPYYIARELNVLCVVLIVVCKTRFPSLVILSVIVSKKATMRKGGVFGDALLMKITTAELTPSEGVIKMPWSRK